MAQRMDGRADGFTLEMKRDVPATREVVVRAFVDPNQLAEWFGPKGYTAAGVEFAPRVGERYRIEMQPPDGERFHIGGEVCQAELPSRLAFTFVYEETHPDDVETQVSLSFLDLGESTEVELAHGPFKTDDRRALHRDGWRDSFDKLERFVSLRA